MKKAVVEIAAGATMLVVSGLALMEALRYSGESGMMPRGVSAAMVLLSAIWLIQSARLLRRADGPVLTITPKQVRHAALLLVAGLALVFGMRFIGFFTTAAILVPALGYAVGYRNFRGLAVATLLFVGMLVGVFKLLLSVPLPPERILTVFGG